MGSGYFPVDLTDENGKKLASACVLIDDVCANISDDIYSGDSGGSQFDNAASDGGSLALLRLASSLIKGEIRK